MMPASIFFEGAIAVPYHFDIGLRALMFSVGRVRDSAHNICLMAESVNEVLVRRAAMNHAGAGAATDGFRCSFDE